MVVELATILNQCAITLSGNPAQGRQSVGYLLTTEHALISSGHYECK